MNEIHSYVSINLLLEFYVRVKVVQSDNRAVPVLLVSKICFNNPNAKQFLWHLVLLLAYGVIKIPLIVPCGPSNH